MTPAQFKDNLNVRGRSSSTPLPLQSTWEHCAMMVQTMGRGDQVDIWTWFSNWCMYLLAFHAVFTIDAIFTIESFGWMDCKNIVHMMIILLLSWFWCMDLLVVHYYDAVQGFTLENIVDFSNIYKVAFTACHQW